MDPARGRGVARDHMPAGKWIVEASLEAGAAGDRQCFLAEPRLGGRSAAIAEHHRRHACRWWRHRMAVEQERAAEPVKQKRELFLNRPVIRPMRLNDPLL